MKRTESTRPAFTLIELLVVISIMAALTALMLPRLRSVNQDRGIREAARVVGSKFAEASDRARRDGTAAVTLIRNPNMVDVDGVLFGVSTISLSRAVPNFTGDDGSSKGTMGAGSRLQITAPLEYDPATPEENVIRTGDSIRISEANPVTSTVAYEITNVTGTASLSLILDRKPTQPALPSSGTEVFYVIERQPKILRSSITDLPPGYTVDLRLSGPLEQMETADNSGIGANFRPLFFEKIKPSAGPVLQSAYNRIDVIFDSTGGISSVRTYRGNWDGVRLGTSIPSPDGEQVNRVITGPLQLFVTPSELEEGSSPLYSETNLWVTVGNGSGGVNIGYNNPPLAATDIDNDGNIELSELLVEARDDAGTGRSASQ